MKLNLDILMGVKLKSLAVKGFLKTTLNEGSFYVQLIFRDEIISLFVRAISDVPLD